MLRISSLSLATLLCGAIVSLSAQGVDSVEVTPHDVVRPVTQNTGTGVGACQQFMPWAYDANGGRVRRELTYVWSVSNSADFEVDTITGGVCARQAQLSDTVATVVTATIVAEDVSGASSFTVTPDPAAGPMAVAQPPARVAPGPTARDKRPAGPGPTHLQAQALGPTTVLLRWKKVPDAIGYTVVRNPSTTPELLIRLDVSAAEGRGAGAIQGQCVDDTRDGRGEAEGAGAYACFKDEGLSPQIIVAYNVLADFGPDSPYSPGSGSEASAMTPAGGQVTDLEAISGSGTVLLSWTAARGASGYSILRHDGVFLNNNQAIRSTTFTVRNPPPGTSKYQVRTLYKAPGGGEEEWDPASAPSVLATPKAAGARLDAPGSLKIATFNLYQSKLPGGAAAHPVLQRWGRTLLSKADVVMITESREDPNWVRILSESSGLTHRYSHASDVAILSRFPLSETRTYLVEGGQTVDAVAHVAGVRHRFLSTHWWTDGKPPWEASAKRLKASQHIRGILEGEQGAVFLGGDLNAYSGAGPQRQSGRTSEVLLIGAILNDAFLTMPGGSEPQHCSDQRIDYVFFRGPYLPLQYEACDSENEPSDHRFVLVTFGSE